MKELSIEEKARAYDEAVEKLRNAFYDNNSRMCEEYRNATLKIIEPIFPELKESEDERIRKGIIKSITDLNTDWLELHGVTKENALAWLEKQGEQKSADKVEPKFKAGDFIADGRRVLLVLATKEERNLGETYSTYCEGLVLDVYGNVLVDGKDFSGFRLATDIERANFVHDLKVGTKINYKPAWSEEDEKTLSDIDDFIKHLPIFYETIKVNGEDKTAEQFVCRARNWLKSLKDRVLPQPKKDWSEEDDYVYNEILKRVVDKKLYEHDLEYIYTWLKSLRPQKQWKPSDADILLLERIANGKSNPQDFQASLCVLIEQIKRLKG